MGTVSLNLIQDVLWTEITYLPNKEIQPRHSIITYCAKIVIRANIFL